MRDIERLEVEGERVHLGKLEARGPLLGLSLVELKIFFLLVEMGRRRTTGTEGRLGCCGLVPGFGLNWCFSVAVRLGDKEGFADTMSSHR
jgi:hypothetical protein